MIFHQSGSYFIKDKHGRVDSSLAFAGQFDSFDNENIASIKTYLNDLGATYNLNILWVGPFLEYRLDANESLFTEKIKYVNPNSIELFGDLEKYLNIFLRKILYLTIFLIVTCSMNLSIPSKETAFCFGIVIIIQNAEKGLFLKK